MYSIPSTTALNATTTTTTTTTMARPRSPSLADRRGQIAQDLMLASADLRVLERFAARAPAALRDALAPRLQRFRDLETHCTASLNHPLAFTSNTLVTSVQLLQDETAALDALTSSLSSQALTWHLHQREALAQQARAAFRLLPVPERDCEAARNCFETLAQCDSTDDREQLPRAMDMLQTAVQVLDEHATRRREQSRLSAHLRAAQAPSEQPPQPVKS